MIVIPGPKGHQVVPFSGLYPQSPGSLSPAKRVSSLLLIGAKDREAHLGFSPTEENKAIRHLPTNPG
jgi:hypothetical protein